MNQSVVIMGVAGCGKSSLGRALAEAMRAHFIEGDDYHSENNRDKMRQGIPLTDADRQGWLETLARLLNRTDSPTILACSALKRDYRDLLRQYAPDLHFIFLEISPTEALRRVAERASSHFFPSNLVDSQFNTLEPPSTEDRVLFLDANAPKDQNLAQAIAWLQQETPA